MGKTKNNDRFVLRALFNEFIEFGYTPTGPDRIPDAFYPVWAMIGEIRAGLGILDGAYDGVLRAWPV